MTQSPSISDFNVRSSRIDMDHPVHATTDPLAGKSLVSTKEAVALGFGSRTAIQTLIREDRVRTIKIGRSRKIVVESLRQILAGAA